LAETPILLTTCVIILELYTNVTGLYSEMGHDCFLDMIYLLTAFGLSPGGSTDLHTNNTKYNTNNNGTTQITTNVEKCGPCPIFAGHLQFISSL